MVKVNHATSFFLPDLLYSGVDHTIHIRMDARGWDHDICELVVTEMWDKLACLLRVLRWGFVWE